MKPLVIYHDHCTDGYGAAFAAWMKLGDEAEYVPWNYNENKIYDFGGREVYILDFSFPKEMMLRMFELAKRVVWLDHHKTAFEMWRGKYEKGMSFTDCPNGHVVILDDNKSGALLAWEWFHGAEVPLLIQHIDDRDRWVFKLGDSKALHAGLSMTKPWDFNMWRFLIPMGTSDWGRNMRDVISHGDTLLRAQDQHVQSMAKQARKCDIGGRLDEGGLVLGYPGLAVNASLHQSEVGHELANQSGTYGLVWRYMADGKIACSLRSNGDYDVSAIAKSFGGGGHRNAAGFDADINTLMGWLKSA